jgi:ABC-2 type transport system permease protein
MFTASSVSLEGESLWVLRSSPVKTGDILFAKIAAHLAITLPPVFLVGVEVYVLLSAPLALAITGLFAVLSIAVLGAYVGLACNLKMPNMHWTNEVAAVKQSYSVLLAMFAGWGASGLIVLGDFLLGEYIVDWAYLLLCAAVFSCLTVAVAVWLKKRGEKLFEKI